MATILDPIVGSCAKKLQDVIIEKAVMILGVKEELREMQRTVKQIQCFLFESFFFIDADLAIADHTFLALYKKKYIVFWTIYF